tara:strand:- start:442 stop:660 length:219 start_codon:yes stop_codon:yes gene_type:complete
MKDCMFTEFVDYCGEEWKEAMNLMWVHDWVTLDENISNFPELIRFRDEFLTLTIPEDTFRFKVQGKKGRKVK